MKGDPLNNLETISINGKRAATAAFEGKINNAPVTVRLVAIEWAPGTYYRFQMAVPPNVAQTVLEGLKATTYSLRPMTAAERSQIRPHRLKLVTAQADDSVVRLASGQPFPTLNEQRFRALNNMGPADNVVPGRVYKVVLE
jgi:predicted Zn-dependent protease